MTGHSASTAVTSYPTINMFRQYTTEVDMTILFHAHAVCNIMFVSVLYSYYKFNKNNEPQVIQ
jgi:hypothetical protein